MAPVCWRLSRFGIHRLSNSNEISEFANSEDSDEVAPNEPPHLDLHYLPSSLTSEYGIGRTEHL